MPDARVQDSSVITEVRAALVQFAERADAALGSLRQEARRTLRWLQDEQPQYWQSELRRAYDRVSSCRISYETCRMRTVAGHRSACIEEKVAVQKAQRRLEYVQQQIDVTRRAGLRSADQTNEFLGKVGPLERWLEYEILQMMAVLDQMVLALEAYNSVSPATDSAETPTAGPSESEPHS
ncbi:hypothetical protein GC163_05780 [bacterium]|nr:hypothetical protein [bacterium]